MKKMRQTERVRQMSILAQMPDSHIDTSDMPELSLEQLRSGVRGQMYRPLKKPITIRLDADVIAWLKQGGRGYQTKTNALLRREMIRSLNNKKKPKHASSSARNRKSKLG